MSITDYLDIENFGDDYKEYQEILRDLAREEHSKSTEPTRKELELAEQLFQTVSISL